MGAPQVQRVRARTMDSAMRRVIAEMGPSARVVGIQRSGDGQATWVEVEAEMGSTPPHALRPVSAAPAASLAPEGPGKGPVYARLAAVEAAIERLRAELVARRPSKVARLPTGADGTWRALGFGPDEAGHLGAAADGGVSALAARFRCGGPLLTETRKLCLVGPPGAGATTTAVKLAARAGLVDGLRPAIVQLDCGRLTAVERLARLAGVLGCPVQTVNSTLALSSALRALGATHRPLIVDVTGRGVDLGARVDAARALGDEADLCRVAVLPADAPSGAHYAGWAETLQSWHPDRLCLTGIDRVGAAVGLAWCARGGPAPLAWVTDGPRIPEDIRLAAPFALAHRLVRAARTPRAVGSVG